MIGRTRFHQTQAPATMTETPMMTPTGIDSVAYWYNDANPRRKAIAKHKPATIPLVKSPQKITVVHRIPAKIPTAATIKRI